MASHTGPGRPGRGSDGDVAPVRITTAGADRRAEISARQRRYVISMTIRTLCFVGAVLVDGWLRWVLLAAALFLPYVAVVMANAGDTREDRFSLRDAGYRRALPPHQDR